MTEKKLTKDQMEVVHWLCQGKTVTEISLILGKSRAAVERRMSRIRETTGVNNQHGIVAHAFRQGWAE